LSDLDRLLAQAILRRAYQATEVKTAQRLLLDLARRLETEYPSAAESVREGLDETLTVLTLKLSPRLCRSLATTNAAESLISRTRLVNRNVKRWRGGQLMLRWVAAGILMPSKASVARRGMLTCRRWSMRCARATASSACSLRKRIVRSRSRHRVAAEFHQPAGTSPHRPERRFTQHIPATAQQVGAAVLG